MLLSSSGFGRQLLADRVGVPYVGGIQTWAVVISTGRKCCSKVYELVHDRRSLRHLSCTTPSRWKKGWVRGMGMTSWEGAGINPGTARVGCGW